jgi:hypothetical protein
MGRGRTYNAKPRTRPKKKQGDRRRREKVQKIRLIKLGADEKAVNAMNPKEVRDMLKRPARVKAKKA